MYVPGLGDSDRDAYQLVAFVRHESPRRGAAIRDGTSLRWRRWTANPHTRGPTCHAITGFNQTED